MIMSVRRKWDRLRTVPGLGRDVGAVVALVVAALVVAAIMQSKMSTSLPWQHKLVLQAEFQSVPGVNPDSSHKVTMAGVNVGKITGWRVTDRGTAVLELEIDGGQTVYDNAHAVLRPKNPLNDMTVEIDPGGPPGKPYGQNGLIPLDRTQRGVQVDEVLSHLDDRTQHALTDLLTESDVALARAPEHLPQGLEATDGLLTKMKPVVDALDTRRQKISDLVTALSQISAAVGKDDDRLAGLADAAQQTLGVLANNDGSLRSSLGQLPGLTSDLGTAMTSAQHLTGELNPTVDKLGAAAKDLPDALQRTEKTVDQLGQTVDKAKPVLDIAKPVVADLRPLVSDAGPALADLIPVTNSLKQDTSTVTTYLNDIRAFVYNTASVFGAGDGPETGVIRGHLVIPLPSLGVLPGGQGGYAPGPENGIQGGHR
jgi:phospholipid/cholesterol/gamma-HCH transport system substrate-binding protein